MKQVRLVLLLSLALPFEVQAAIFADVPDGHPFQGPIERLYQLGITAGCATNPLRFCPDAPVTRAQMATFLLRASRGGTYTPPPPSGSLFADVPATHPFAPWIEELARSGITAGCATNPPRFCPQNPVTRAHMAAFLGANFFLASNHCRFSQLLRINAPFFGTQEVRFDEMAVAWFGQLNEQSNHADIRVGFNQQELYVYLASFDRHLWFDPTPAPGELSEWDAVTLLLDTAGSGVAPPHRFRFTAQLFGEPSPAHRASWVWQSDTWQLADLPFSAVPGWRGGALNDNGEPDRGWAMGFRIPWASLNLSSPPALGALWRMALILHDRDWQGGPPVGDQSWPPGATANGVSCWGLLRFGLPSWQPARPPAGTATIRRPTSTSSEVPDADVGGTTSNQCPGDEFHIWNLWPNLNWGTSGDVNVQNQSDVADWPCFSRYYVTFPLTAVPPNKHIVSATLTLHQFGNAGGSLALPSWIQVLIASGPWVEHLITWNNAPLALENVGGAWVDRVDVFPGWPGVPRSWDVSYAVARAYALGEPVRLVLYAADSAYHSGKYFVSSDTGDWNSEGRPTLTVVWGDP
ncbi:MAG: DNRLRE domain-containing protein [Thermoanaerobaculum sp.]|nr:DNRLRE domain-containing protein [Thermoanaerobaculum sp.]